MGQWGIRCKPNRPLPEAGVGGRGRAKRERRGATKTGSPVIPSATRNLAPSTSIAQPQRKCDRPFRSAKGARAEASGVCTQGYVHPLREARMQGAPPKTEVPTAIPSVARNLRPLPPWHSPSVKAIAPFAVRKGRERSERGMQEVHVVRFAH